MDKKSPRQFLAARNSARSTKPFNADEDVLHQVSADDKIEPCPSHVGADSLTFMSARVAPLLADIAAEDLCGLGVTEQLIDLAVAVTDSGELDQLVSGAPLLSKDILYGLAAGMSMDEVRREITAQVEVELGNDYAENVNAALERTTVTTFDEDLKAVIEEGDFRTWKVFLHPSQTKLMGRRYDHVHDESHHGPARPPRLAAGTRVAGPRRNHPY